MKKILVLLLLIMLAACSDQGAVGKLKTDYPNVKKEMEQLPTDVQKRMAAPETIPFQPKDVQLTYASEPVGNPKGDILHTEFVYGNEKGLVLRVTTFHNKNTNFNDEGERKTTKLKDGTEVIIERETPDVKAIRWSKDDVYYGMMLMGSKFEMEDLLKSANSMDY
ncbi:hypothetical protein [Fictibacillus phosphorivorans]|uniref:hypothetical protein n=1 Tax=Fictibacillus phosphorivorans TaxID=1221500 RepID=UPI0012932FA0|nr:hypothetical protein [Fictibacillus phosphorivorans]MQR97050.1 hypothetical protein [Fictibacillus phosphorivorans]